jgi:hypothetical protein
MYPYDLVCLLSTWKTREECLHAVLIIKWSNKYNVLSLTCQYTHTSNKKELKNLGNQNLVFICEDVMHGDIDWGTRT